MIRALTVDCSAGAGRAAELAPEQVGEVLHQPDQRLAVEIAEPAEDEFGWLERTFAFHPLAIEDCRHSDQRPKLEEYDGYLFITVHSPRHDGTEARTDEVHAFLGPNYVVIVHDRRLPGIETLFDQWRADGRDFLRGIDFVYYRVADRLIDEYFPLLEDLDDEIDKLEDALVENPDRALLNRIFELKQDLVVYRKVASPQREVFNALLRRDYPLVQERNLPYYRDIHDHLVRVYELLDSYRDLLSNALDAYLSTVSNNLNEVMKRLTIVSTIFLPLTFITGLFGMNFTHLPFDNLVLQWATLLAFLGVPIGMLWWFRQQKWL
jgi:magnesium transporter